MASGEDWTYAEVTMVCYLYLYSNRKRSEDKKLMSEILGRSEKSISAKMDNLARFDPIVILEGKKGLTHGSKIDESVWIDFQEHPQKMITEAQKLIAERGEMDDATMQKYYTIDDGLMIDIIEGQDIEAVLKRRLGQEAFRRKVLHCANEKCCITGINEPRLLVASHIKPWICCSPFEKTDVHNALCLNRLHDGLFDKYLMTIDEDYKIIYAPTLEKSVGTDFFESAIAKYDVIRVNNKNKPSVDYIVYHNNAFRMHNDVKSE